MSRWSDAFEKKAWKQKRKSERDDRVTAKKDYLRALKAQATETKYKAKPENSGGYSFDSGGERGLFEQLKLEERAGLIRNIRPQQSVYLSAARIEYIADFLVFDRALGCDVWVEFKGVETASWRIKRRLWMHYGPGVLRIFKKDYKTLRIFVHEEISGPGQLQP